MSSMDMEWPRASDGGDHAYGPLEDEPAADVHEMQDMNTPKPSNADFYSASIRSGTTPLLGHSNFHDVASGSRTVGKKRKGNFGSIHGWRMGVALSAVTASTVFVINLVLTVWALVKYGLDGGIGTIHEGSCARTKNLSLWLHLAINALSTLLLGASNYSMQCLASPTREEIDKAHKQRVWLDIGVPTVRNLRRISWYRIVLWWLLAISGIPLHLLYNSAVFSTLSSQQYSVFGASPELLSRTDINWSMPLRRTSYTLQDFRNVSSWEKLDNAACIRAYAVPFVSGRGDLVTISSSIDAKTLIKSWFTDTMSLTTPTYGWMCSAYPKAQEAGCDTNYVSQRAKDWVLESGSSVNPVQYCLSKPIEEHCQVQFSIIIMSIIIICNFLKALCMFLALWRERGQPLVTLGDAVDTFLRKSDPTTQKLCLAEKSGFMNNVWDEGPLAWKARPHKWFSSTSKKRWLICNFLCITTLIATSGLLRLGVTNTFLQDTSISHLWQMGYGVVTSESIIALNMPGSGGLLLTVLIANSPQVLLSFLFLTYNGLYTCMLLADEWNGYAHERKPLRVTDPRGDQRSTYRLQLPYKYGIPLLLLSGTLHWLVSQSLFLARVTSFYMDGLEDDSSSISTVGYSCIAIITVIALGSIVVIAGILIGFRKYKPGIPLAGSCSAAISAACHQPLDDEDAALKPVMWGAVSTKNDIGHCCLTSLEVTPPLEGERYAGLEEQTEKSPLSVSRRRPVAPDIDI